MLRVIKPNKLRKGDTIGIIAPGGPVNAKRLKLGVQYLRNAGFVVKLGENIFKKFGYLAGRDSERVQDLHSMLIDPEVNAIFIARGGYGSLRLLPSLDYELVRTHPKIIVGYSDITALQWAILSHTGLVTFSGPMAAVDFGADSVNENAASHLWALLTRTNKALNLNRYNNGNLETLNSGKVSGPLLCGCLTVIAACIGTQFCPDFNGAVLVLEDIGEEPYKLDRAITFLALHGVFDKIGGLVLGQFTGCNSSKVSQRNSNIENIIKPIAIEKKLPALTNLPYGHVPEKLTLPIGIMTALDANNRTLTLTEDAVS